MSSNGRYFRGGNYYTAVITTTISNSIGDTPYTYTYSNGRWSPDYYISVMPAIKAEQEEAPEPDEETVDELPEDSE